QSSSHRDAAGPSPAHRSAWPPSPKRALRIGRDRLSAGTFDFMLGHLCLATFALTAMAAPAQAARPSPPQQPREIQFSGHTWLVKDSGGAKWGPGPNVFSPSTENVWVDGLGRLHLRITKSGSSWRSAEVISNASFGYGTYRWTLASDVSSLDAQVVL